VHNQFWIAISVFLFTRTSFELDMRPGLSRAQLCKLTITYALSRSYLDGAHWNHTGLSTYLGCGCFKMTEIPL